MSDHEWEFGYNPLPHWPALAWVAWVDPARSLVSVTCGGSVRREPTGFFEGTWAGESNIQSIPSSTTVFGSGILMHRGAPLIVPPAHSVSGLFTHRVGDSVVVSNSLPAILECASVALEPGADYPSRFMEIIQGVDHSPVVLPATPGPLQFHWWWNLRVGPNGEMVRESKPTEEPFNSYADYRSRLSAALASAIANASGYEPVVALSSGYDSTAVAVLVAELGGRRVVTFADGRPRGGSAGGLRDTGADSARRLGMNADVFDRRDYVARTDLPEAEFLATGMSGEDVVMSAFESRLHKSVLFMGTMGNGIWRVGGARRTDYSRSALDGGSLEEFRLRLDCYLVMPPLFGQTQRPSVMDISASAEMKPYRVGGRYDEPIPRRIAEEAGLPRGSFAVKKRAASALIHSVGESQLAPTTRMAVRAFATAEGAPLTFEQPFRPTKWDRALLKVAPMLGADRLVQPLRAQRLRLGHFDRQTGNLLLRWAVDVIRPRYRSVQ